MLTNLPVDLFLPKLVSRQLNLRFFDVAFNIQSDSATYLDTFELLYPRFQVTTAQTTPVHSTVELVTLTGSDNTWGKPVMFLNGHTRFLHHPELLKSYAYELVIEYVVAWVQSHLLIHAGVVAHNGQGIMIVANSMHGKTTTVLELVRRGFKFLSDDIAALGRTDHLVHPFPRSLRIRQGTLERVGLSHVIGQASPWLDKQILDIEAIVPNSISPAVPVNHIVFLDNPANVQKESRPAYEEIDVYVDNLDEELLTTIRQIDGVVEVKSDFDTEYKLPFFNIKTTHKLPVRSQIGAICWERQILITAMVNKNVVPPTFDQSAQCQAIPRSQGIMELIRQFQGGLNSIIYGTCRYRQPGQLL